MQESTNWLVKGNLWACKRPPFTFLRLFCLALKMYNLLLCRILDKLFKIFDFQPQNRFCFQIFKSESLNRLKNGGKSTEK